MGLLRTTLAVALTAGLAVTSFTGCQKTTDGETKSEEKSPRATPAPVPSDIWKSFSGENALALAVAQVEIGPRPAGSEALEKTRQLISAELEKNGWKVERQTFTDKTPRGEITFTNLIGRFGGSDKTQRFIIASHFDTKLYDTIHFTGANDGASSTGALMELARVLSLDPELAKQVELIFFDGEEAIEQFTDIDGLYGSRYYARTLRGTPRLAQFKAGVVWDMIGDRNLTITLPRDSPQEPTQGILAAAETLSTRNYFSYTPRLILDDHVPLNQVGIPTVDLIDFDYPYWHTADDTLDKISAESLQIIGSTTLLWLKQASEKK